MQPALKKRNTVSVFLEKAIDMLLPPRCIATGEIVDQQGMISPAFWQELQFIEDPFCITCGIPFSFKTTGETLCVACMDMEPEFDQARAAVTYNDASRKLVLAFKYGDRLHAVHTFTPWMIRAGQELIDASDMVIPVPLHLHRLRARRFNQSALLAQEIAKRSGKAYTPDALLRSRHTVPQKGLSAKDRRKNVQGAFEVKKDLKDRSILLIDDVFTSGATLNECARVLKKAGAACVNVLTIARVTKEEF